jgi:argininosuccinate synthase
MSRSKTSSSPSPAASTPASACPGCRSAATTCTPCSPTPAAWMPKSAPTSRRARGAGRASHVTVDGGPAIWDGFVKPFVWAGEGYQGQYPLLVSDRYLIVDAALASARRTRHQAIAHGCTGMGNDQVRFDLAVKAPSGRLRDRRADPRDPEGAHPDPRLRAGLPGGARLRRARQAEELHHQREPARRDHVRRRDRRVGGAGRGRAAGARRAPKWPTAPLQLTIGFERGEAVALDGERDGRRGAAGAPQRLFAPTASAAACTPATPPSA